jgi:hypothetical protein
MSEPTEPEHAETTGRDEIWRENAEREQRQQEEMRRANMEAHLEQVRRTRARHEQVISDYLQQTQGGTQGGSRRLPTYEEIIRLYREANMLPDPRIVADWYENRGNMEAAEALRKFAEGQVI